MRSASVHTFSAPMFVVNGYPASQQSHLPQHTVRCFSNTPLGAVRSISVVVDQFGNRSLTPGPMQRANHSQQNVNHALAGQGVQRPCLSGSLRAPSRSCLLSQVSHIQTSGSWAPEEKPGAVVLHSRTVEGSGRLGGSLPHRPRVVTSPTLPMLAQRDKVSKATEQLNEGSSNSVQQDIRPQTLVEEECQAEDMQTRALLEEKYQNEDTQPQVSLEDESQTEDMPSQLILEEECQTEDAMEIVEAEDCGECVAAPAAADEKSAVSKDGLIQTQDCGESVPAQSAAEDMPTISTTELTEAEDFEESVPALAATPTISTLELSEAYVLTQDSMPEFVEVDFSEEESLALNSLPGKEDLPTVKNSDSFSSSWMRNASWSHSQTMADSGFEPLRKTATPPKLRRGRTADLEVNLSACRKALEQLKLQRKEYDALTAQSPNQQVGEHPLLEKASSLSACLTDLAAESLECGCNRDVPGAMDVYEQANTYLDTVSDLLQSFTAASMQVEDEEEAGDAAWPPLESHKSDEMSTAPAFGLSRFLRVVGS